MSCRVCDHTMHNIVAKVFWCPRCGTLKHETSRPEWAAPGWTNHYLPQQIQAVVKREPYMVEAIHLAEIPEEGHEASILEQIRESLRVVDGLSSDCFMVVSGGEAHTFRYRRGKWACRCARCEKRKKT